MTTHAAHAVATEALALSKAAERRQLDLYWEIVNRLADGQRQPDDSEKLSPIMQDREITYEALSRDVDQVLALRRLRAAQAEAEVKLKALPSDRELRATMDKIVAENLAAKEAGEARLNAAHQRLCDQQAVDQRVRALGHKITDVLTHNTRLR